MTPNQAIEADARQAATTGKTPNEACPWPFTSPQGKHWMAVYLLNKPKAPT